MKAAVSSLPPKASSLHINHKSLFLSVSLNLKCIRADFFSKKRLWEVSSCHSEAGPVQPAFPEKREEAGLPLEIGKDASDVCSWFIGILTLA